MESKFAIVLYKNDETYVLIEKLTKVKLRTFDGEIFEGLVTRIDSVEMGWFELDGEGIEPDEVEEILEIQS